MKRWELSILIGLILAIFTTSITSFAEQCDGIRDTTVRLHILANSDSEEDQALKLQVRDAVLAQVGPLFEQAASQQEAVGLARESIPRVEAVARETLRQNGCSDAVHTEVVNMYFATRRYENGIVMPAGRYDAVRILIGEGAGQNWWCVMFPPMCLPAAESEDGRERTPEEELLLPDKPEYRMELAVVEAYESIKEYIASNARQKTGQGTQSPQ